MKTTQITVLETHLLKGRFFKRFDVKYYIVDVTKGGQFIAMDVKTKIEYCIDPDAEEEGVIQFI